MAPVLQQHYVSGLTKVMLFHLECSSQALKEVKEEHPHHLFYFVASGVCLVT